MKRWQFSLRSLMLLTTATCLVAGIARTSLFPYAVMFASITALVAVMVREK